MTKLKLFKNKFCFGTTSNKNLTSEIFSPTFLKWFTFEATLWRNDFDGLYVGSLCRKFPALHISLMFFNSRTPLSQTTYRLLRLASIQISAKKFVLEPVKTTFSLLPRCRKRNWKYYITQEIIHSWIVLPASNDKLGLCLQYKVCPLCYQRHFGYAKFRNWWRQKFISKTQ